MTDLSDVPPPVEEAYVAVTEESPPTVRTVMADVIEGLDGRFVAVDDGFEWLAGEGWEQLATAEPVTAVVWRLRATATEALVGPILAGADVVLDGTTYVFRAGGTTFFKRFIAWYEALSSLGLVGVVRPVQPSEHVEEE
jgi:hypothetical protein